MLFSYVEPARNVSKGYPVFVDPFTLFLSLDNGSGHSWRMDINRCIHLPQNRLYCMKNFILHYLSRSLNTNISRRCHGNHRNNRVKLIAVIILTGKVYAASACNYHSENIAISGQPDYYNQKQNKVLTFKHGENGLPAPKCFQPNFQVRDLYGIFLFVKLFNLKLSISMFILISAVQ